jgi:hypothetical protein
MKKGTKHNFFAPKFPETEEVAVELPTSCFFHGNSCTGTINEANIPTCQLDLRKILITIQVKYGSVELFLSFAI